MPALPPSVTRWHRFWICASLLCASGLLPVHAACQFSGQPPTQYAHFGGDKQLDRQTAVGQHVFDFAGTTGVQTWRADCVGNEPAGYINQVGAQTPLGRAPAGYGNSTYVYQIAALPGLGYAPSANDLGSGLNPYFQPYGELSTPTQFDLQEPGTLRVDFFVMSSLWSGRWCLPAGQTLGEIRFDNRSVARLVVSGAPLCIQVSGTTCEVSTGSRQQTVLLGRHALSDFQGISHTTPERPFHIGLTRCSAGISAVNLRMLAAADPDHPQADDLGLVALTPGGATGVAVQLLDGARQPLPLNRYPQTPAWQGLIQEDGSDLSLPFFARYYQTREQVSAGLAQASVLFEVVYR